MHASHALGDEKGESEDSALLSTIITLWEAKRVIELGLHLWLRRLCFHNKTTGFQHQIHTAYAYRSKGEISFRSFAWAEISVLSSFFAAAAGIFNMGCRGSSVLLL